MRRLARGVVTPRTILGNRADHTRDRTGEGGRMSGHPRRRNERRLSTGVRTPQAAARVDPAAALRSLIQEGIVTAAALNARDDLITAAMSMQRLGSLTSGMWRALSRELATADERLERES